MTVEQEIRMLEEDQKELAVTLGSLGFSVVGLVTGFGEAADAANAVLFYSTGHPILGTLSGLSALPIPVVEQALGLTVGTCLLVKVLWIGAKIIKSAVVIVTKTKFAKPAFAFVKKSGRFFQFMFEKGKICFKQIKYELTHNSMKPDYINLGSEITLSGSKTLMQKLFEALRKIGEWVSKQRKQLFISDTELENIAKKEQVWKTVLSAKNKPGLQITPKTNNIGITNTAKQVTKPTTQYTNFGSLTMPKNKLW